VVAVVLNKLLQVVALVDLVVDLGLDRHQLLVMVLEGLELSQDNRKQLLVVPIQIMELPQLKMLEQVVGLEDRVGLVYKIQFLEQLHTTVVGELGTLYLVLAD
jgi:hypothetical protein